MKKYKNIIFDMDDTLSLCSTYYIQQKNILIDKLSTYVYSHSLKDSIEVIQHVARSIFDSIDLISRQLSDGYGRHRYPRSFAATGTSLCIIFGVSYNSTLETEWYNIGDDVFKAEYRLFDGVIDVLEELYTNYQLILWTKGDDIIQNRKVDMNNLRSYFKHIEVVSNKNSNKLQELLVKLNINSKDTILVGDSYQDEIQSAQELEMDCIWVTKNNTTLENIPTDRHSKYLINKIHHVEEMLTMKEFKHPVLTR